MTKPVYVLRTCKEDLSSSHRFQWPASGFVKANDWDPSVSNCKGLYGLLWGRGDGYFLDWSPTAKWLVVRVDGKVVDLGRCVKFKSGFVEFCGDRKSATDFIIEKGADPSNVVGASITVGDYQTSVTGYHGTSCAGNCGEAVSGDYGNSSAGQGGKALTGDMGTASVGVAGSASAGEFGKICIKYLDRAGKRSYVKVGYTGDGTLEPYVLYTLNEQHDFVQY